MQLDPREQHNADLWRIAQAAGIGPDEVYSVETLCERIAARALPAVEITEAQVEAAAKVLWDDRTAKYTGCSLDEADPTLLVAIQTRATARAVLLAASLARPAEAKVVKVKPLPWVTDGISWQAIPQHFICYNVSVGSPNGDAAYSMTVDVGGTKVMRSSFGTLDAAKAAAQADYEARILSALEPVAEAKAERDAEHRALDFIARWAWRETDGLTDTERLSSIKYHPLIVKRAGQPVPTDAAAIRNLKAGE